MNNLRFYKVDMKYIRDLAAVDDNVMSVSPQDHKDSRPFLGIIVICNEKSYCVPLTSPKSKHTSMKNREDFSRIIDSNGKIIGALNFNNMIPVTKDVIIPLDIQIHKNDDYSEQGRKKILNVQLDWCNNNKDIIIRKANKLYHLVINTPDKMKNLTRRCCNFKKLEEVLAKYTLKNNQNNPDKYYYIPIENEEQLEKLRNSNIPFKINKDKTAIIVDISDKERAKKCISEIQSKKNQHKLKL